jgi:hypothetical protein
VRSEATASAFLATPRHLFVTRYREWGTKHWHHVCAENLQEHLAALYAKDDPARYEDNFGQQTEDDDNRCARRNRCGGTCVLLPKKKLVA